MTTRLVTEGHVPLHVRTHCRRMPERTLCSVGSPVKSSTCGHGETPQKQMCGCERKL